MVADELSKRHLKWFEEEFGAKPFFESREDYEAFCQDWYDAMIPIARENAMKRADSELLSRETYVF
jgi:hypothetical protein